MANISSNLIADPTSGALTLGSGFNLAPNYTIAGQTFNGTTGDLLSTGAPQVLGINDTTTSTYNPQAAANNLQIGNINSGISRLDNQRAIGHQNVLDSYNNAYSQLLGQKQQADTNYKNSKDSTGQDNVLAKNNIASNVGYQANALQRLLGAHGSGSSSAALLMAPYAAARQGSIDRTGVDRTFAKNNQALDQNYGNYGLQYDKSQQDLLHQKDVNTNQVDSGIDSTKATLLQQLAGLQANPAAAQQYIDQSNALLGQVDNLGKQYATPVQATAPPTYTAPSLDSYAQPTRQALQVQPSAATDTTNPFTNLLFGNNKDKLSNKLSF
jgi:hypothetical protein